MTDIGTCLGLLLVSFLAATLLPLQSEAALVGAIALDTLPIALLVAVASLGNVLGSIVNWLLGRYVDRFRERRWFPVGPAMLERARRWYGRYGRWSLLASWLPVIGDPLTLVAGVMREPLGRFVLIVAMAKTLRYIFVAAAARGLLAL
ncbi:MAG: DedA family protein [Alphaproteobacteria bacterium]|nr:DedA family protein [Alphaproteobacteria bacterium]